MVEGARLESVYSSNAIAGSNPVLSARRKHVMPFGMACFLFAEKQGLSQVQQLSNVSFYNC